MADGQVGSTHLLRVVVPSIRYAFVSFTVITFTRPRLSLGLFGIRSWQAHGEMERCRWAQLLIQRPLTRRGIQGTLNLASESAMDNEFKTHVLEDVIKRILEKGQLQEVEASLPLT